MPIHRQLNCSAFKTACSCMLGLANTTKYVLPSQKLAAVCLAFPQTIERVLSS